MADSGVIKLVMWTQATRGRMAEFEKKTKRYPTDLTDEEWARIEPFVPGAAKSGRPARTDLGEVLNAIRTIEIIRRSDTAQGFEVLPRRWVVERTFGWMTRWRRLVRDYEERIDCSQAMIHVALGSILLRRIAHQ